MNIINKIIAVFMTLFFITSAIGVYSDEIIQTKSDEIFIIGEETHTLTVIENSTETLIIGGSTRTYESVFNLTEGEVLDIYDQYYKDKVYEERVIKSDPQSCDEANIDFLEIQELVYQQLMIEGQWTKTDYKTMYNSNEKLLQLCGQYPDIIKIAKENKELFDEQIHQPSLWVYEKSMNSDIMTDYTDQYVYDPSCDCKVISNYHR
jgi:hypothetical protein